MAESEMRSGTAVQEDVGTTFRRWATDLGRTRPASESAPDLTAHGILDALLGPAYAPRRTTARPLERAAEPPVSMVKATAMREVLATWRETERELAATPEDSPEWPHVNARLISLRVAYRRLFDEATAPP